MLPLLSDILSYEIEISATHRWVLIAAVAVVGATLGSFMNVVVYRLPRRMSLSRPASRCPKCEHPIRWHDNVPVFGWLMLRGRCRDCGNPIAARYPLVEGLVALVAGAIAWRAPYMVMIAPTAEEDGVYVLDGSWIVFYLLLSCVLICSALIALDGLAPPRQLILRPLAAGFLLLLIWAHLLTSPLTGSLSANAGGVAAGFLGLLVALLLSVGPCVAVLATTELARFAWAAAALGELMLVGVFVGEQRIVWIAPEAMLLYVATACLAQKWTAAGRFGWAGSLTVVTLIWLLGGDHVAVVSPSSFQAYVGRVAIAFSLMLLLAIVPVVLPRKTPAIQPPQG